MGKFIADCLSIRKYYIIFSVFDFVSAATICIFYYFSLCQSRFFQNLKEPSKRVIVALFLSTLVFPFFWIVPWERPETLPSGLYLSLSLSLSLLDRVRFRQLWLVAILMLTLWQAFVRADIAMALGGAMCLFSLTPSAKQLFGSRSLSIFTAFSIVVIVIAIQAYLKIILFPHATYPPDSLVVQLFSNLGIRPLTTWAIAMLPCLVVFMLSIKYRKHLEPLDILAILISCVYLPIWWTVGIIIEVRIFVPFLLALTPTAAKLIYLLLQEENALNEAPDCK
jgi:hypothetical protein